MALFTWTPEPIAEWKSVESPDIWSDRISVTVEDEYVDETGSGLNMTVLAGFSFKIHGLSDQDSSDDDFNDTDYAGDIQYDVSTKEVSNYIKFEDIRGVDTHNGSFRVNVPVGLIDIFPIQKLSYAEGSGKDRTMTTVHSWKDLPKAAEIYEYRPYPKNVRIVTLEITAFASDETSDTQRYTITVTHNYDIGKKELEKRIEEYKAEEQKKTEESKKDQNSGSSEGSGGSSGGNSGSSSGGASGGSSSGNKPSGGHAVILGGSGLAMTNHVAISTGHDGFPPTPSSGPVATSVFINNKPVTLATVEGTKYVTHKRPKHKVHPSEIRYDTIGHPSIEIEGMELPACTIGDGMADGDMIATGDPTVVIGL